MKQLSLLSTLFLSAILICCASPSKDKPVIKARAVTDSCVTNLPHQNRYVNDFTSLFAEDQRWFLDSLISENEKNTTNQIAVVTIDSNTLGKCLILDFARALGNEWGIGKKEKNNGIAIVICVEKKQIGIATGDGIEKILSNEEIKSIIDNIITPEYKKGNYFEGTKAGLKAIFEKTTLNTEIKF